MTETPILCTGIPVVVWEVERGTPDSNDILNNQFTWPDIDITYNPFKHDGKVPLPGQKVKAKIMLESMTPQGSVVYCDPEYVLKSIKITSNLRKYPYPGSQVDPKTPTEYGGVIFYEESGGNKQPGEYSECGIVEGFHQWINSNSTSETTASGYIYVDVFDQTEFSYIPMNETTSKSMKDRESYAFEPLHPDVLDPLGKNAPILPMNSITAFVPDSREEVTVTYKVIFTGEYGGQTVSSQCTIKQTCFQDTGDYGKLLNQLLTYCNWANTRGISREDFSMNYPYTYPYTYVRTDDPVLDPPSRKPKRGDVWYNPVTKARLYYSSNDIPESFTILKPGTNYRDSDTVQAIWTVPTDENGKPLRRCDYRLDEDNLAHSLSVSIKTDGGKITSIEVSDFGSPANFRDGDIISILGGNNDAKAKINISGKKNWTTTIVKTYGNTSS